MSYLFIHPPSRIRVNLALTLTVYGRHRFFPGSFMRTTSSLKFFKNIELKVVLLLKINLRTITRGSEILKKFQKNLELEVL